MMSILKMCLFLLLPMSVFALNTPSSTKVIYGDDDRVEPHTVTDAKLLAVSNAVAAMIPASAITLKAVNTSSSSTRATTRWGRSQSPAPTPGQPRGAEVVIKAPTLSERGICASERFNDQITAANCSGFLVSDELLVTAGHCVEDASDCKNYRWVFGYQVDKQGKLATITEDQVFECKEIVGRELNSGKMTDFAVIRLNKKATNITPMKINLDGKPAVSDEVVVLGHPTGLPQKIAGGAEVKKLANNFFYSNLDTYGGNSGSAVINARTYEVEGILVRGQRDYIRSPNGSCSVSNVLSNEIVEAEEVSFISQVFSTLGINNLALL
jgi:V8-like Glu-specific endopeptidase